MTQSTRQGDTSPQTYDVFISYSTHQEEWVEILARNLQSHGIKPFFAPWSIVAGDPLQSALARGIANAHAGILIATPESLESGWVQQEYARLSARAREDPSFRLIPVAFGKMPPYDFIEDRLAIHFDDETSYDWAFHRLICGLRGRAAWRAAAADVVPGSAGSCDGARRACWLCRADSWSHHHQPRLAPAGSGRRRRWQRHP